LAVTVDHNPISLRTVSTRTLRACEKVHNSPTVVLRGTLGPDAPTSRGLKSKLSQGQEEEQTRLTVVTMLQWRRFLAGVAAVSVVFLATALWVVFYYEASESGMGLGTIVWYTLRNPMFWVLSVVACFVSYRFTR
jgi:hypothetical protein